MPKFEVVLAADRYETNTMIVEADNVEEACKIALTEDDGDYEPGDLGESYVEAVRPASGFDSFPIPMQYVEPQIAAMALLERISELSASGDGETDEDPGHEHDTGDSLDTLDAVIMAARKMLGKPHDDRADVFLPPDAAIDFSDDAGAEDWSGSPCPEDPDNYWIDDKTGERVNATTGERTPAPARAED